MKNWVSIAQSLLSQAQNWNQSHVKDLRDIINNADTSYYVNDNPVLADAEYDTLFAALKKIENQNPSLITIDSPTQRVAAGLTNNFENVPHLVPMLSLENSYNADDLIAWDKKCKEATNLTAIEYCIEPKYDGASISLIYENNILTRAATRGDGVMGDNITNNAKQIKTIPLSANFMEHGIMHIEIRGEVLITKENFANYNASLSSQGLAVLANARNAASGSLRIKDSAEVAKRNLHAFMYHVSYVQYKPNIKTVETHFETLKLLQHLGIKSSFSQAKIFQNIEDVIDHCNAFELNRDAMPFEIDGMVIKVNNYALQDQIGQTSHHPKWAMAFKFKARQATSKLLDMEYQVGRTGAVTPVAKIAPVAVGGVMVSSISVHNHENILEKDLRIGDTILIERAGDVIPYLVKNFPELRDGSEAPIEFPTVCPICKSALEKPEAEAIWRCVNYNCSAQIVERIIHFASKDAMDIRGLGDANIRKFFELGIIKSILDLYNLPYETLCKQQGFGEKSMEKLQAAIEKSKQQSMAKLIFGLGIRYVGETTAKTLSRKINNLTDLYSLDANTLKTFDDVGEKVAESIVTYFADAGNRILIEALQQLGIGIQNNQQQMEVGAGLQGKTFLFTGTLTQLKRSAAEALVEQYGGNIIGSVSTKLNYLVVGEDAGSKLEKAKKLTTVEIISEQAFLDLIENSK
jgi:DNA ligase (NAD+)